MMWLPISMVSVAIWWILPCAECPPSNAAAALPICEEALVEWIMPLDYTGNCPPLIMTTPPIMGLLVHQSHSSLLIVVHTGVT